MGPMDLADVGYDAFLVNGQAQFFTPPTTAQKTLRLRMINASASSYLNVRFAAGPMQIIAADGIDVVPIWVNELTLAIAETYDVIVRVPDEARYELRATSVDGSGYSSTWIGSGNTQVTAHDYTPPNPYLMNHNTHGEMAMHETEPSTYGEHNSQGINHTTTHPPMHMPELAPSSHGEHSGHSMDHSPSDSGDMNTHMQPQPRNTPHSTQAKWGIP